MAAVVMSVYAFTVIAPYFFAAAVPTGVLEIIKSNKSTVDLITTAVVMFYFGASVGRRKDQENIGTLVNTNAAQVAALVPVAGVISTESTVTVNPGESVTVAAIDKEIE